MKDSVRRLTPQRSETRLAGRAGKSAAARFHQERIKNLKREWKLWAAFVGLGVLAVAFMVFFGTVGLGQDRADPADQSLVSAGRTPAARSGVRRLRSAPERAGGGPGRGVRSVESLDDVGQFARVRMEFLKRLCSAKHGIYNENVPSPISGEVHVYGVGLDGRVCEYLKHRSQAATLRQGRT